MNAVTPTSHSLIPPHVFLVDDEEIDRVLFARAMQEAEVPHPCRVFSSGDGLLEALIDVLRGAPAPVACFVDVKMAGMGGLDVLRWIRAQPGLNGVPVVMLSSSDDPQCVSEAMQFGAQCYVAKFPPPDELRSIVAAAENYCEAASCASAFHIPGNLLSANHAPAH